MNGFSTDGEVRLSSTELHGGNYHLVGADLRNLGEVATKLRESEVNYDLPTLFLAECVLVYIEAASIENLLSWLVQQFHTSLFVNYEQVFNLFSYLELQTQCLQSWLLNLLRQVAFLEHHREILVHLSFLTNVAHREPYRKSLQISTTQCQHFPTYILL